MPTTLSVRASDLASGSRVFGWPVLESGNGSFENGVYSVTCDDDVRGRSFLLEHTVLGAPLIEEWMRSNRLIFVCAVASPRSMYRVTHKSYRPRHSVIWQQDDLGDFPTFTPMIVTGQEIRHVVHAKTDGLNAIWDNKELLLPRAARLAIGPTFRFQSGISGMLDFKPDLDLANGRFRVEPSSDDGFKFIVYLAGDLYTYLRYRRTEPAGMNVMVHIVSAALVRLREQYISDDGEEGWRSFPNLVALADTLQQKKLSHWADEDFRPEVVATALHPHQLPMENAADDGHQEL